MNTFGRYFRVTTFGESHGSCIGGVIDGCPAGLEIDNELICVALDRRKGLKGINTARQESDRPHFLSGLLDGVTTGTPIAFTLSNRDRKSGDYDELKSVFRPSHADYTYQMKYGIRDCYGGGRASARETTVRVVAGTIAYQILQKLGITITAFTSQIGEIALTDSYQYAAVTELGEVGCPDSKTDKAMHQLLQRVRAVG